MTAINAILIGVALAFLILAALGAVIMLVMGVALIGVIAYERILAYKNRRLICQ